MISISKLLFGTDKLGDQWRYHHDAIRQTHGAAAGYGPVVVWNTTRTCNLRCMHCYSSSDGNRDPYELTTNQAVNFISDLAAFHVPVLLFSGGEPLLRDDLFQLVNHAVQLGIRTAISTNGTLLTGETARKLKHIGTGYVGISLDGIGENNDRFRGRKGAFSRVLEGIRNCREAGLRVGLRFTINRHNYQEIGRILDLVERENIPRVCFYHLVYSGRGSQMISEDISRQETRAALDLIIDRTLDFHRRGLDKEILTVDNHADGIYIYLKARELYPKRADKILELLQINGGNRSGIAIGAVDWGGNVHPDQFTQHHTLGNVKERNFTAIWTDLSQPVLNGLRNRKELIKGRCARCRWFFACNGNFRARAEAVHGDFWDADPACYLTDEEIEL